MSVYSIENLKEVMGDDPEFIAVVVQTFLDEIPPDLEGLKAAVAEGDRKRAYGFAHKMKPNIEMFGVDLMKNIRSIETWSRSSKDIDSVQGLVDEVDQTLNAVFTALVGTGWLMITHEFKGTVLITVISYGSIVGTENNHGIFF